MADFFAPFDPQWLMAEQILGGRVVLPVEPVEDSRKRFTTMWSSVEPLIPKPTDAVTAKEIDISKTQRARVYRPSDAPEGLPVGLYIHSGGWFSGSIEREDFLCRIIAEKSQMVLFSPSYRLAPENPYPAGLDDVCTAYEFMHTNAGLYGGDSGRKFVMGGSAGGSLAISVALKYTTNADLKPLGVVAACISSCDPDVLPDEYKRRYTPEKYSDSPMIGHGIMARAREWYDAPSSDPLFSTLLHPDIVHLPQVYLAACTKDPTHQDTLFFYEECKKQGVDVEMDQWVGWPHFFWILPMLPMSAEFMKFWCRKLKGMVAKA